MGRALKPEKVKPIPQRLVYPAGEACMLLCCSINFLRAEIADGKIGYIVRNNRKLIPAAEIEKYVREHTQIGGQTGC